MDVQYWLGTTDRDQYGNAQNPALHDGPHDDPQGVVTAKASLGSGRSPMISERTPGEKLAYADGFKQSVAWFESRDAPPDVIEEARALHTTMLATLDPPKQAAPNDHWCVGCSPIAEGPDETVCGGCERPRSSDGP